MKKSNKSSTQNGLMNEPFKVYQIKIIKNNIFKDNKAEIETKYFLYAESAFNYILDNNIDNFVIDTIYLNR